MTDKNGGLYQSTFDAEGRLTRDENPAAGFWSLSRTGVPANFEVTLASALGRTTTYHVETLPTGDTSLTNTLPTGLQTGTLIGTNGDRTMTSPDGMISTLSQLPDPRFGLQAPAYSLRVETPGGLISTMTESRTASLTTPGDPLSLTTLTRNITVNGRTTTSVFDRASLQITETSPAGRQRVVSLDSQGRIVGEQITGLEPSTFTYDARGRLVGITQGNGATARTTTMAYNAQGFLDSLADPLSRSVSFGYDLAGRVTQQTLPDLRVIGYGYDANGNVTSITPPSRPAHDFAYTPVDLENTYTPPDISIGNVQTQYAYNLDKQITQVTRPDGLALGMTYDTGGRLGTLTLARGTVTFGYHPTTGNLQTITAPGGNTLTYSYDGSLLTGTTWAGPVAGTVSRTYDTDFRLATESINGGQTTTFGYDADSLLTQAGALSISRDAQNGLITGTTLGDTTTTQSHTTFGETEQVTSSYSGTTLWITHYTRDKLGRITENIETIDGVTSTYGYSYDLAGRLTDVTLNGINVSHYTYDANGNRLSDVEPTATLTGSYDAQDRLLTYGSYTYTYTANGELASKYDAIDNATATYQYDEVGNLIHVATASGTQIEYVIDGQNRRVGKKVNGVLVQGWLYANQLNPVAELDGTGAVVARFVYGTKANVPDYMVTGGVTYRILSDHLGSPRIVINTASGVIAQRLDYDEFGNVTVDSNIGFQPFGFAGGLYDADTGLVRFGARDYDAFAGRWTVKDPIRFAGGDTNLFGYVISDPQNAIDPTGLDDTTNIRPTPGDAIGDQLRWIEQQDKIRRGDPAWLEERKVLLDALERQIKELPHGARRGTLKAFLKVVKRFGLACPIISIPLYIYEEFIDVDSAY
jgi:RHS repeat-associated protein